MIVLLTLVVADWQLEAQMGEKRPFVVRQTSKDLKRCKEREVCVYAPVRG